MPNVDRRRLLAAGGAVIIAALVGYAFDPRAGVVVLILLLGIIVLI